MQTVGYDGGETVGRQIGLYEKAMPDSLDIRSKLKLAKAAGYDYVELSVDESEQKRKRLDMSLPELNRWKCDCDSERMPFLSMCLSAQRKFPLGSRDRDIRAASLDILRKAVRLSAVCGIRLIQLPGYDVYYEETGADTQEWFLENLYTAVQMAARWGVILAFETMETPFMNTVEKAMHYVKQIASPYLQVYPDVGNLTNGCDNVPGDLHTGEGHIVAAHLKETVPGVFRNLQFGEGRVDFVSCVQELRRQRVGMLVTEFWYDGSSQPLPYLQKNRRFFEKIL